MIGAQSDNDLNAGAGGGAETASERLRRELLPLRRASLFTSSLVVGLLVAGVLVGGIGEAASRVRANAALLVAAWVGPACVGAVWGVSAGRAALARLAVGDAGNAAGTRLSSANRLLSALLVAVFLIVMIAFFAGYQFRGQDPGLALLNGISFAFLIVWMLDGFLSGQFLTARYVGGKGLRHQRRG